MDNEAGTSSVDKLASPAPGKDTTERGQLQGADSKVDTLERTSSVSDEYLRFLSNPENVEKRFPVDRKKLERLIIAGGKDNESAEDYFRCVMDETGTLILWPSKLKIGAKSKKDPQVKVVGLSASVQRARELILVDLDAKASRVTLKIDVSFAEHSHVIGKEGANIKKIHDETKCHIHFPDSNRSLHGDKSNQVSITGNEIGVEVARMRIRELLPLVVTFPLPMPGHIDPNSPDIQQMAMTYNVHIHIKPQPRNYSMLIVVRGTVKFLDGMKVAVSKIVEYFTGDYHSVPFVSLNLDIAPQHHRTLIGSGGGNIRKIMQETGTTIQFPDPQSRYYSNQVTVVGEIDCVLRAREQLLGCLPVVLMFDVHDTEHDSLTSSLIGDLMQQLDVFISVKHKPKQPVQSVIIKSIEQNMQCMYQARAMLLDYSNQPVKPTPASGQPQAAAALVSESTLKEEATGGSASGSAVPLESKPLLKSPIQTASPEPTTEDLQPSVTEEVSAKTGKVVSKSVTVQEPAVVIPEVNIQDGETKEEEEGMRRRSLSASISSASPHPFSQRQATLPPKLTMKAFLNYDRKREEAQKAMRTKVEPSETRYPTTIWTGLGFSKSMTAGGGEMLRGPGSPTSPTSTKPQGLSSINRSGFQVLVRQASLERNQALQAGQDLYRGVTDVATLLQRLSLEKYLSCFEQEEVDFETFLTMTESDLKEIGISTLGARRKLQIAISELKKMHSKPQSSTATYRAPGAMRSPYQNMGSLPPARDRTGSLKRSTAFSQSVRF